MPVVRCVTGGGQGLLLRGSSRDRGDPGVALGGSGEGFEGADTVPGGGGEVAADGAEGLGSGHGPHAPGDLYPQLAHPDHALGFVVQSGRRLRMVRVIRRLRAGCG